MVMKRGRNRLKGEDKLLEEPVRQAGVDVTQSVCCMRVRFGRGSGPGNTNLKPISMWVIIENHETG